MADRFGDQVLELRPRLLAHCYRMTGALSDAEDALQEALVRAWRAFDTFEGRSSLSTWLYKITTNACLDLLASRRARTMPEIRGTPTPEDTTDPAWLEPFPTPDAAYESREAVRLAFVVALQVLPSKQRAALLLRDVVGLSAEETAEALDTSVAAINSALQRARAVMEEHPRAKKTPITGKVGELLGKYLKLWEAGDAQGLVALLRDDATLSMPPHAVWAQGPDAIRELLTTLVFPLGKMQLVPCLINGAPAFASYIAGAYAGLTVLDIEGDRIVSMQSFLEIDPVKYGLPARLEARSELVPGAAFGRYRLELVLGSGGMGDVWLAHDTELDRPVALKVLRQEQADSEGARERLLREARAMARLRHPNVVTVYDVTSHGGHDALVMELVEGDSLLGWAARGQSQVALVDALVAAGRGLAAAHAGGLVHRDFKPANVLVGSDGRVLVGDFGLARDAAGTGAPRLARASVPDRGTVTVVERPQARADAGQRTTAVAAGTPLTREGSVVGTPAYMSPEQLRGDSVDARTDQFSFCLTAWELLAGRLPFSAADLVDLARGGAVTPADADRVPEPLRGALARGMSPDPDARWPSMTALLEALHE
jgi:RNA polymerase sigma-70 factor (TIGR02960 family)